ncbi:hypothetical protein [Palleronia sp. LCG004]|uniref:hypothetical protein n=1 Tax=Palleronia sp. LCG004 TaxID=3079304 RepID=UPI002941DB4D|nr:hypothetical protein [Palleronia sp. LCG004]WOI57093.1 hypothetical protein RVY76_04705 [Palleronia sp. LCG004]
MIRGAAALCLALAGPVAAATEYGLVANKTGLSLVFPLQVESPEGRDLGVTLREPGSEDVALSALLEGGAFFRVLVPPGTYVVRFAPLDGDGPSLETRPLTFEITGPASKGGHLLTLDEGGIAGTRPIALCQSYGYDAHAITELRQYWDDLRDGSEVGEALPVPPRRELSERLCD